MHLLTCTPSRRIQPRDKPPPPQYVPAPAYHDDDNGDNDDDDDDNNDDDHRRNKSARSGRLRGVPSPNRSPTTRSPAAGSRVNSRRPSTTLMVAQALESDMFAAAPRRASRR